MVKKSNKKSKKRGCYRREKDIKKACREKARKLVREFYKKVFAGFIDL